MKKTITASPITAFRQGGTSDHSKQGIRIAIANAELGSFLLLLAMGQELAARSWFLPQTPAPSGPPIPALPPPSPPHHRDTGASRCATAPPASPAPSLLSAAR